MRVIFFAISLAGKTPKGASFEKRKRDRFEAIKPNKWLKWSKSYNSQGFQSVINIFLELNTDGSRPHTTK